jgi:hypothetical protein
MSTATVQQLYEKLGNTPNKVADSLRKMGCKGKPFCIHTCPLAKFLLKEGIKNAKIFQSSTLVGNTTYQHQPAIAAFARNFDNGQYHNLILTEE